jgi:general secretion pathway protein E
MLEQVLRDRCGVTDEDMNKALKLQGELGGNVGLILVQIGAITDGQLTEVLSGELNIPLFKGEWVEDETLVSYLGERLSYDFLIRSNCLPLSIDHDNKKIHLLIHDPFNYAVFDYIFNQTGYSVQLHLTTEQAIKDFARNYTSAQDYVSLTVGEDTEKLKEMAFEAPVIKFLNSLLSKAVETRSSDIHIESSEKTYRVRFRIDGILHDIDFLEESFYLATVSRIKLLAGLDIAENRLPQDGKFTTKIASLFLDIRVSTMPTTGGGGVVMRLLYREKVSFDLEYLGLEADHKEIVVNLLSQPYGILLVTGPTGSGKTTTLYSMLTRLNSSERKIITIEDPVEYQLEGINQIQVKSEIGLTFASALRSILRHDPDIIMVGEIRDRETAEISIQSALTGHFVLSTLHTNDAPSSLFRLVEMEIADYLMNAAVVGVLAQRIVRKNCSHCSQPVDPPPDSVLKEYGISDLATRFGAMLDGGPRFMRGRGCQHCAKTGYRGRIAIFELFHYTDELKEVFLKKCSLESLRAALRQNDHFRVLREDGMLKVLRGSTTIEEVLRVC